METEEESSCCTESREIFSLVTKLEDPPPDITCITQHPGFEASCLNHFVLQIAYYDFRQEYGAYEATIHEQFRYCAYRQLIRWAYKKLGRNIRKKIPACALKAIRNRFPDEQGNYKRFCWPDLDM